MGARMLVRALARVRLCLDPMLGCWNNLPNTVAQKKSEFMAVGTWHAYFTSWAS